MRDFELAAVVLIAWVLLYDGFASRSKEADTVWWYQEKYQLAFEIFQLDWKGISLRDFKYKYRLYTKQQMNLNEFTVYHDNGNEIRFERVRSDAFKVSDKWGKKYLVTLGDYSHVKVKNLKHLDVKYEFRVFKG